MSAIVIALPILGGTVDEFHVFFAVNHVDFPLIFALFFIKCMREISGKYLSVRKTTPRIVARRGGFCRIFGYDLGDSP
jgi:hypothetical protein